MGTSSDLLGTSPGASDGGHAQPVKDAKFLGDRKIVSAGIDRTIRIWNYIESDDGPSPTASIKPVLQLYGHKSTINNIAVHQNSSRILSASDDHSVGYGQPQIRRPRSAILAPPSASSYANKRRKVSKAQQSPTWPLSKLSSHTAQSPALYSHNRPNSSLLRILGPHAAHLGPGNKHPSRHRTTSHPLFSLAALSGVNS